MIAQDPISAFQGAEVPLRLDRYINVPSLNIFLGSTPGYAGLEVMRRVAHLPELDRHRVAFLYLDIDSPPAEVEAFRAANKGKLTVADLRIGVAYGASHGDALPNSRVQHTYIPGKIPQSFDSGAGGIRNNGHVAACTYHTEIQQAIDELLASLKELPQDPGVAPIRDVAINIVAFLGGGTGSGILPDITVMVREQVTKLNLPHRLNVFCLLPEQFGEAASNDVAWRKSNATATLLEMLALSLARDGLSYNGNGAHASQGGSHQNGSHADGPTYIKYMLNTPYAIEGTTIANEVYLFGNTSVSNAVDAARIIGIDLYSRIANSSGVGYLEHSKSVDRRTLDARDPNRVPTMFGTTCPLEVVFPGPATANAFALITAAKVLPQLGGELDSTAGSAGLSLSEQAAVADWLGRDKLQPLGETNRFQDNDFARANGGRIRRLRSDLKGAIDTARESIAEQAQDTLKREQTKIRQVQSPQSSDRRTSTLSERIAALESSKRVYEECVRKMAIQGKPSSPSDQAIEEAIRHLTWAIPVPFLHLHDRAVAELTRAFNQKQNRAIEYTRWVKRKDILDQLLAETKQELVRIKVARRDLVSEDIIRSLRDLGEGSAAWNAQLDEPHVHRRHLFDLPRLQPLNPVKRLYELVMRRVHLDRLDEKFMAWMRKRYSDELDIAELGIVDLRFRLVEYLCDVVFLPVLQRMNLLDLLRECCVETAQRVTTKEAMEDLLFEHLENMRKLARPLVTVETQLWAKGADNASMTVFLGMNYHDGTEEKSIRRAVDRLGQFHGQAPKPLLMVANDPHLMQLVFGQHAFSLGTVPDFYYDSNSSMSAFQHYQADWYGDGATTYGRNKAPVFSSGEMERLVMDPVALGYNVDLPHRIIRPTQGFAGNRPTWGPNAPNGGPPPFTNHPNRPPYSQPPNNQPPGQNGQPDEHQQWQQWQQWDGNFPPGGGGLT